MHFLYHLPALAAPVICPRLAGSVRFQPAGRTFGRFSPARVCRAFAGRT